MDVRELTIAEAVNGINLKYFLPIVQRPFVWKKEQIIKFFDSVMKGYPFGTVLLWVVPNDVNSVDAFPFSTDVILDEKSVPDPYFGTANGNQELVLDGQQRLTSLLIGCRGSVRTKEAGHRNRLYIDLLKDPSSLDDGGDRGYGFVFKEDNKDVIHSDGKFLFKVSAINRVRNIEDAVGAYKNELIKWSANSENLILFERNFRTLYNVIMERRSIVCTTHESGDGEEILDIFVRLNSGGSVLTTGDLLTSTLTMYWPVQNGRDEFKRIKSELLKDLKQIIESDKIDDQFLMKSLLFFFAKKVEYDIKAFSSDFALKVSQNWDALKIGLRRGLLCAKYAGFDPKTLVSANALLPVAYFCHVTGFDPSRQAVVNQEVVRDISKWLRASMVAGVYSHQSDAMLKAHRDVVERYCKKGSITSFPGVELNNKVAELNKISPYSVAAIDNIMRFNYENKAVRSKIKIALGMIQETIFPGVFEMGESDVDHLYPKNLLKRVGVGEDKDIFANLAIMYKGDNRSIKDAPLPEKLEAIDSGAYKNSLCIDPIDFDGDEYYGFIERRGRLLRGVLMKLFLLDAATS